MLILGEVNQLPSQGFHLNCVLMLLCYILCSSIAISLLASKNVELSCIYQRLRMFLLRVSFPFLACACLSCSIVLMKVLKLPLHKRSAKLAICHFKTSVPIANLSLNFPYAYQRLRSYGPRLSCL